MYINGSIKQENLQIRTNLVCFSGIYSNKMLASHTWNIYWQCLNEIGLANFHLKFFINTILISTVSIPSADFQRIRCLLCAKYERSNHYYKVGLTIFVFPKICQLYSSGLLCRYGQTSKEIGVQYVGCKPKSRAISSRRNCEQY